MVRIRKIALPIIAICFSTVIASAQKVEDVSHVAITVSDLDRSADFFKNILSFTEIERFNETGPAIRQLFGLKDPHIKVKSVLLSLGNEYVELIEFAPPATSRSIPPDSRSNDLWFQHIAIVTPDMPGAYENLWNHKVPHVSTAPQTLPDYISEAAGISAFYFRDQDGHNLEIIFFPEGKGDPRWQKNYTGNYAGIDHTAIAISDTETSLKFYHNLLGLTVAGQSENYGTEQEHLNQVFGARLLITGLHAQKGIGVEFLNYIAPPGGRPYPADSKPTDLWHWHIAMKVDDIELLYQKLLNENVEFISTELANLKGLHFGTGKGFLVRDPDGHAILLLGN